MVVQVKICGLTTQDTVEASIAHGASWLGFVAYPASPRYITPQQMKVITGDIPSNIPIVLVGVDMDDQTLASYTEQSRIDMIQCHGHEAPDRVVEIQQQYGAVIKAISVRNADDVATAQQYESVASMLLFDAKAPDIAMPGGNGLQFDWQLLRKRHIVLPWMLSGGLNQANLAQAVAITGATKIDASSALEDRPGVKNIQRIKDFLELAKTL